MGLAKISHCTKLEVSSFTRFKFLEEEEEEDFRIDSEVIWHFEPAKGNPIKLRHTSARQSAP